MAEGAHERLDLETAERLSAALDDLARTSLRGRLKPSPREAVADGLLEVRQHGDHLVCLYDPAVADVPAWDRALREQVGAEQADLVRYRASPVDPAQLVGLQEQVLRRDWHPDASTTAMGVSLRWDRGLLEISLRADAADPVSLALLALVGHQAEVTFGARLSRGGGRR